ncbi:MAG: hypothetical protein CMO98_10390 [Woeseia sp.]|nr:hypothetical protein [Woeseia sp.]|tara:strand:+ start:1053 stop:1595 length:543 start_codon:yes stop_codon:yes gene_type:complete
MITGKLILYKRIYKLVAVLSVALPMAAAAGQEDPEEKNIDRESRACISVRQIRHTDVIDDQNILFFMRGGTVYLNMLPRRCTMLRREKRFMYETRTGGLCRREHIRILTQDIGSGGVGGGLFGSGINNLMGGVMCSLGAFYELSEEDVEAFKMATQEPAPKAKPLPMPEPEEVDVQKNEG